MIVPFLVEAEQTDGTWEAKAIANSESSATAFMRVGKTLRRIQGVRVGEWRVVYMTKEDWS